MKVSNKVDENNFVDIGRINKLKVVRKTDFGCFLDGKTNKTKDDILLHKNNTVSSKISIGDIVEVFVYKDKNRLVATERKPLAQVGEIAKLKVVSNTGIGSFVDIGIEKDILVPFKEKKYRLMEGEKYLFFLYLDKSSRLAATSAIDLHLESDSPFKVGDHVSGTVYGFQTNKSAMVAVHNKYVGVILRNEYYTDIHEGFVLNDLKVIKIYEDGKLCLSSRVNRLEEMNSVSKRILSYLEGNNGFMAYNDKSDPEDIRRAFNTSKKNFKRALGSLMKAHKVSQNERGTYLLGH